VRPCLTGKQGMRAKGETYLSFVNVSNSVSFVLYCVISVCSTCLI
jgi:hypothetical protein